MHANVTLRVRRRRGRFPAPRRRAPPALPRRSRAEPPVLAPWPASAARRAARRTTGPRCSAARRRTRRPAVTSPGSRTCTPATARSTISVAASSPVSTSRWTTPGCPPTRSSAPRCTPTWSGPSTASSPTHRSMRRCPPACRCRTGRGTAGLNLWDNGDVMTSLPARVRRPAPRASRPRHLADLDVAAPPRGRHRARPAGLSRRPAEPAVLRPARERPGRDDRSAGRPCATRSGRRCCRPLLTEVRTLETDAGTTRKTLWRLHDGALVESVLMRYPDADHRVRLEPGRLRHGLPVLRDRPGRPDPQPVDRRDRRPGRRRGRAPRASVLGGPAAVQRGVHGHGRAARELRAAGRRAAPADRSRAGRARSVAARDHRVDGRAGARDRQARPTRASTSRWPCRCTPRTTNCATPSSR